jgi:hypothetical protein
MFKYITTILFFICFIQAQTINFNESKYISALEMESKKYGTIIINSNYLQLSYKEDTKTLSFFNDKIIKYENNATEALAYEDHPELEIFYKLLKFIYTDELTQIEEYFKIEKEKNLTKLIPNDYISNVIEIIEFRKKKKILEVLEIFFTNEDRIRIVQTK